MFKDRVPAADAEVVVRLKNAGAVLLGKLNLHEFALGGTSAVTYYGLPTISVPCGFSSTGLPIGLQISANHFAESTVLALAHAYEQATDWHKRRPSLT